jgi:hypothetical protein
VKIHPTLIAAGIALLVAGCGEKAAESTPTPAPAPAVEVAKPAPVTDLASALTLDPGIVHPINSDLLATIDTPVSCSIDSINGAAPDNAVVSTEGSTQISGWTSGNTENQASAIVLAGDSSFVFRNVIIKERPDIAKLAKLATGTAHDFRVDIAVKDVPPGSYKIYVIGTQGDGIGKCVGNSPIVVK